MQTSNLNNFIQIISNYSPIRSLPVEKKKKRIEWILTDLEKSGIFEPISFKDDDLELLADLHFGDISSKKLLLELAGVREQEDNIDESETVVNFTSLQRIRRKRQQLSKDPNMGIVLDETDFMSENILQGISRTCSYGRTPLHEAIHLRDLGSIEKLASEKTYLNERDNNGNTPYEMAFHQKYREAMKILKKYMDD